MVKRKTPSSSKRTENDPSSAAQTIIDADMGFGSKIRALSRAELLSGFALLCSVIALGLAVWPVLSAKTANERQAMLSQQVEQLSDALERMVVAQSELAQSVAAQQGLSQALQADMEKLSTNAEKLTDDLQNEMDLLAKKLQQSSVDFLENLSKQIRTTSPGPVAQSDGNAEKPSKQDQSQDAQPSPSVSEKDWLPQWAEVPLDKVGGWLSGLITIRKSSEGEDISKGASE